MKTALILIDVQMAMFLDPSPLWRGEETLATISSLLTRARAADIPVFHVQHDGAATSDPELARGSEGWRFCPLTSPLIGEVVIEKRHYSAFQNTDLHQHLKSIAVDHLVIAGMQTECCVDTACRVAASMDYRVTLVENGHTTFDGPDLTAAQIIAHHNRRLARGFAQVKSAEDIEFHRATD